MDCSKADRLMMKHMDKTISAKETEALTTHMSICDTCKADMSIYKNLTLHFEDCGLISAPAGFDDAVMKKLDALDFSHRKASPDPESLMCAVIGILSVIMAVSFVLIANRDQILDYMSAVPSLSGAASVLRSLGGLMESYFNNFTLVLKSAINMVTGFLVYNKLIFFGAFAAIVLVQSIIIRKKKDRIPNE